MTKNELRTYYLSQRKSFTDKEIESKSNSINNLIINALDNSIKSIHSFIPIPDSEEVNTWGLIHHCWQNNIRTATSITHFNPKRLENTWINDKTEYKRGLYNLPAPTEVIPVDLSELDLVIVPLLCIDKQGNRIGYGQGFYDIFLSKLSPGTKKLGVSLFDVLDEKIEADPWDVPLEGVVTSKEIIYFS